MHAQLACNLLSVRLSELLRKLDVLLNKTDQLSAAALVNELVLISGDLEIVWNNGAKVRLACEQVRIE
jgi:hypothetical protein